MRINDFPTFSARPPRPPRPPRRIAEPQAVYFFSLPWPPSLNHAYVNNPKTGGRFKSKVVREWQESAIARITSTSIGLRLPQEPLALHIRLYPPGSGRRRFDCDGKIKPVQDALCAALGIDDDSATLPFVSAMRMEPDGEGRCELALETFAAWRKRDGGGPWLTYTTESRAR